MLREERASLCAAIPASEPLTANESEPLALLRVALADKEAESLALQRGLHQAPPRSSL